jgi:hypothetical protein
MVTKTQHEGFSTTRKLSRPKIRKEKHADEDPRIKVLGRAIEDDFAMIRENYGIVPFPRNLYIDL